MYKELCNRITEISGIPAEETTVLKNGIERTGVVMGEGKIRVTLYPKDFDVDSIDKVANQMIEVYEAGKPNEDVADVANIINEWDKVKDNCILCVRPHTDDETIVKESFLDLEKYVRLSFNKNGTVFSVVVTKALQEKWGVSTHELFGAAKYDIRLADMGKFFINGNLDEAEDFGLLENGAKMLVVSNPDKNYGATAIAINDFWDGFARATKEKFYIIPSSIHELIVMVGDDMDAESLREMVREVNNNEVSPEERLSYSVYEYKAGKVQIAA